MLLSVQILRAVAALLVLAFHVQYGLINRLGYEGAPKLVFGAAGVDIFFVVSGFIMVWSTRAVLGQKGAARTFLARRLVRILPLYWLTTTVFLVGALAWPPENFGGFSLGHVVASYLFIPWPDHMGIHAPLYGLGWTLNYEMFFYVVFAACLGLAMRRRVMAVTGVLLALVALGRVLPDLPFVLRVWSQPLVLEFAAGTWIALARLNGATLPGMVRTGLLVGGFALLVATEWLPAPSDAARAVFWGVPAAMMAAGAALGPEPRIHGCIARVCVLLGDASYSIYLVHFLALSLIRRVSMRFVTVEDVPALACAVVAGLIALGASVAVHLLFERPVHRFLLARLGLGGRVVGQHRPV